MVSVATVWMERQRTQDKTPCGCGAERPRRGDAASYQIDTSFYRRGDGDDTRLRAGDHIAPGDALFMKLQVSTPTYVYIVNEDDQGESLLLFPLPGQAVANPIAAETMVRVPGTRNEEISWQVSNVGGREHFLIFASPERVHGVRRSVRDAAAPRLRQAGQPRRTHPDRNDIEAAQRRRPDDGADGENEREPGEHLQDTTGRRSGDRERPVGAAADARQSPRQAVAPARPMPSTRAGAS